MKINILHLYYDLMNLYGEIGNIKAITHTLEKQNIKYKLDLLSINDSIDFAKYDLVYVGCSTENNLEIVKKDIIKYKEAIKKYIDDGKILLSTGNSYELFVNGCLNIFDYNVKRTDCRLVGDVVATSKFIKDKIIGFINTSSIIDGNYNSMFNIIEGKIENDGINYKNFYSTLLLGPLIVRNPELHKYIITKLINEKYPKYKLRTIDLKLDKKAYDRYMNEYHNN